MSACVGFVSYLNVDQYIKKQPVRIMTHGLLCLDCGAA